MEGTIVGRFLFLILLPGILIVPALVYLRFTSVSFAALSLLAYCFLLFFIRFEDIAEISLGPLRAKMKEQIEESAATVEQLRSLASAISRGVLTDLMAGQFFDGMTLRQRLDLHESIINELRSLGVSESQINEAETNWRKGIGVIYHRIIRQHLQKNQIDEGVDRNKLLADFQDLLEFSEWDAPSPERIRSWLGKRGIRPSEELNQWIGDYEMFIETNTIPRRREFEKQ